MELPLLMWLFQGVPEAIGVAAVMFAVAGLGLRWRTIVPMGILFGAAFYLVRLLPISFGVHTVINFLFVVLVFKAITSSNLNIAIRGGIVGLLTVIYSRNRIFYTSFRYIRDKFGTDIQQYMAQGAFRLAQRADIVCDCIADKSE